LKDYYTILGVPAGSSPEAVKKAYRRLAMRYHPDRNGDNPYAAAHFREVQEAYEVLSDYTRRQRYHQERQLWRSHGKPFADATPVTPQGVLSQAIGLGERARRLDRFRMNPEGLASDIADVLEGDTVSRLLSFGDPDMQEQIVRYLMEAAEPLPVRLLPPLLAQWRALGGPPVETRILAFHHRRQREENRSRYVVPLLFLLTLVIVYLIYRLA
jgi:curved DNA-binding protein CbpA